MRYISARSRALWRAMLGTMIMSVALLELGAWYPVPRWPLNARAEAEAISSALENISLLLGLAVAAAAVVWCAGIPAARRPRIGSAVIIYLASLLVAGILAPARGFA